LDFCHIKRGEDETIPEFHVRFINTYDKIPPHSNQETLWWIMPLLLIQSFVPLLESKPTNLGQAFLAAQRVEEFLKAAQRLQELLAVVEEHNDGNLASYQVSRDEQDDDDSCLDDQEPVVAKLEPCTEFHKYEARESGFQVCSLVSSINDDKIQQEEQQTNDADLNQQESLPLHIPTVVQEQFDQIPLQQGDQPLVQPEDDLSHNLPMILQSNFVLQGDPLLDHCLDIRVNHDPIELRMMEVFQQLDSKSFGSHTFMFIIVEVPCSKFQPTAFINFFSSKHNKAFSGL
jgi:hypothetical protein